MPPVNDNHSQRPKYWSSLSHVEQTPSEDTQQEKLFDAVEMARHRKNSRPGAAIEAAGFVEESVLRNGGDKWELTRRDFLKLSGAAVAFATAGCALRPTEKIIPYVKAPEEITPGVPLFYASTLLDGSGTGVLIKTREGRPIKIEGNPDHPLSQGRLTARGQASIYNLYDPDRLPGPVKLSPGTRTAMVPIPWQAADQEIGAALSDAKGRVVLLTGTINGPARTRIIREFLATFPGARHVMADAWTHEVTREAQETCYGKAVLPSYHFDKAEYVLDLGSDFMGSGYSALQWQVDFGKGRKVHDGKINKLVTFESYLSMTGANADERFRVHPSKMRLVAQALAQAVAGGQANSTDVEQAADLPAGTIARIAGELKANSGKGIVVAGEDKSLQIAANVLNSKCGNDGVTVDGAASSSNQSLGSHQDLLALMNDMRAGKVDVLIVWGTNPGYWLPKSAGFADAVSHVKTVVSFADRVDETAMSAHYLLPGLHYLESWGDSEPQVGLYSLTQPTILPLHDNRAVEDSLIAFAKAGAKTGLATHEGDWHQFLADTWKSQVYTTGRYEGTFENFWNSALRDGLLDTRASKTTAPRALMSGASTLPTANSTPSADLILLVYASPIHGDGRTANNAWLYECPDPVSKITWSNYASLSPATARTLGIDEGQIIRLEAQGVTVEIPAHVQAGDADGVVSVQSGWGRTYAGRVADGIGLNAFGFRGKSNGGALASAIPCAVTRTHRTYELATVQRHDFSENRPIIYETTLGEYLQNKRAGLPEEEETHSLWKEWEYLGNRWGMAIDLTSCIGCHACTIACMVENNIPVVGEEEVNRGRVMHWIRIDRYYSGPDANPDVVFQPMLCQHCENAPCETVCPVIATLHDDEGLNIQVYNRCVGTRYCSNNCPYKVRRFNWHEFSFAAFDKKPLELVLNPDVTVREKGVMEKCMFCFQRIRKARDLAKDLGRQVQDSDMQTACQQTCPTNAITFGNLHNPDSAVDKHWKDERSYRVLEELDTKPSIVYWTKLRNRPGSQGGQSTEGHHA